MILKSSSLPHKLAYIREYQMLLPVAQLLVQLAEYAVHTEYIIIQTVVFVYLLCFLEPPLKL